MVNIKKLTNFEEFIYFGIKLEATLQNNEVKKICKFPSGYMDLSASCIKPFYDYKSKSMITPNGIAILTQKSNISVIDVDKPEDCSIYDKLMNDCKWIHKTRKGAHFIFKNNDLPRKKQCGIVDINTDLLYFIDAYKDINTDKIVGGYEVIKHEAIIDMPEYAYNYCKSMIKTHSNKITQFTTKIPKPSKKIVNYIDYPKNEILDLKVVNELYKIHYEAGSFNGFNDWFNLAFCGRNINNTPEGFKLFIKYSRMVVGYENESIESLKTHFYDGKYVKDFDEIGCLVQARKLSTSKFLTYIDPLLKSINLLPTTHFNRRYIYPNINDLDYNSEIEKFNNFTDLTNPLKILGISSPYGTGKTYAFKEFIKNSNFESVLFITYRQSLANSLYTELHDDYNFDNYKDLNNDQIKESNRLIIQLDSLPRLIGKPNYITGQIDCIKKYDLVLIDECEGVLNHINSGVLQDKQLTFDTLVNICNDSSKIFICDGDLAERSYDFIKQLTTQYKIFMNDYKSTKKNIIFERDGEAFDAKIEKYVKNNKKIVICCMLASDTLKYQQMFKDYNVLVHSGTEKNKQKLINYKKEWLSTDILIYSPTIEAGVDFDISHFDACFGTMSDRSTSARAFSQMLHRVRNFTEDTIYLHIGNLNYNELDFLYYPITIKNHYFKNYDTSCGLANIQLHNKVEEMNSKNYIISDFIRIIKRKGYTFEFNSIRKKCKNIDYTTRKDLIENCGILELEEYSNLINKQKNSEDLLPIEVAHIDKYFLYKTWHIPLIDITRKFIDDHFRKEYIIKNYNSIMSEQLPDKSLDNNFIYDKIEVWNPIVKLLKTSIKKEEAEPELVKILDKRAYQLFNTLPKSSRNLINNINSHIFNEVGLKIVQTPQRFRQDGKIIRSVYLSLAREEILNNYFERLQNTCLIQDE